MSLRDWIAFTEYLDENQRWGLLMRRKMVCSDLRYRDRAYIAAFGFSNGINPELLTDALAFVNSHCTPQRVRKIHDLYDYWTGNSDEHIERRRRYYAYNINHRRVLDLNWQIRDIRPWERVLVIPAGGHRPDPVDPDVIPPGYHC